MSKRKTYQNSKNGRLFQSISIESLNKCISNLSSAFLWDASPQGFDYWSNVYDQLVEIKELYNDSHSQHPKGAQQLHP